MIGAVCLITDPDAPLPVVEQALAAARGGAWCVQLRDKVADDAVLVATARQLMTSLRPFGTKLIVNDRVEAAIQGGADGLHIGQSDGDPATARDRLGPGKLLGLSVETVAQGAVVPAGVDYVGAGPVRTTPTKPDHAPAFGFEGLAEIAAASSVPVVAIGGLGPGDARALKQAGAVGMAVVSAVTRTPDPEAATRALVREWRTA